MRAALFAALLAAGPAAFACGYCVEDKIASVYDHAVVSKALGAGRTMAFVAIDGALKPGAPMRLKIESIARSAPGVDAGSVRLSMELATLAFAYDPGRASLAEVQAVLDRKLAPLGLSLLVMRLMDRPGDLVGSRR